MADFSNIIQQTRDIIHDNEQGEITSQKLRLLILDIINDVNQKKLDNTYVKDGDNYYITIGDKIFSIEPYHLIQVVYSDINISSFSYQDISDLGGSTSTPIVTYSQTKTTYIDGLISNIETITGGATKSFSANSILNATLNTSTGVVTCNLVNTGDRRSIGNIRVTVSMNGKIATRDANVYQAAYVERIPDYYIGFCNYSDYNNLDYNLMANADYHDVVYVKPNYPSQDGYVYFSNGLDTMYLIYNEDYDVLIDTDGEVFDFNNQTVDDIFIPSLDKNDIQDQGKTYKVKATYIPGVSDKDGYRFKFSLKN